MTITLLRLASGRTLGEDEIDLALLALEGGEHAGLPVVAFEEVAERYPPAGHAMHVAVAYARAAAICEEDVAINQAIGRHGRRLIEAAAARKPP